MAEITTTSTDLKPTYAEKPDMRFGTTFLSNKYRDYAVKGESLMDKATGEIFTKRPQDGRVVSFFQNKKYMHELMLELRVMLNNNGSYRYPDEANSDAYYLNTDYDIMSIFNERDLDISTNDMVIPNTTSNNDVNHLKFNISKKSNGFFCRLSSRDSDKAIIEWITSQYNTIIKNYNGTNQNFIDEKEKFSSIPRWEDSNAVISYDVTVVGIAGITETYSFTDYIRINEESCVLFPETMSESMLSTARSVTITINSITYDKIHFMLKYKSSFDVSFIDGIKKFMYPDNAMYIRYCNIGCFIDKASDINLLGNEFIIAMLDVPYVRRYMMKMSTLTNGASFILSPTRPGDEVWSTNGIWAEQVRNVYKGSEEVELDCEVNIKKLEMYLAENVDIEYVNMTTDPADKNGIYLKEDEV